MKLWNSIMSGVLLAPLAVAVSGCPSDDTGDEGAGTTTDVGTTTTGDDTTGSSTAVAESSTGTPDDTTTTGEPAEGDCHEEREIPAGPPVDCSGASTVIMGSVIIEENGDDPSMLEGVVEVTGAIRINRVEVTDLNFMACVRTVGADVTIFGNDQLTNVDGLWSLETIGTDFVFSQNDAMEDFNGLPNVEQIDGNLVMRENASLRTITGFHRLVGLNGMGLDEDGNTIGGNVTIQQNPVLEHIDGLGFMKVINGVLAVTNNPTLCISSIMCVVEGIVQPAEPPQSWSTVGNDGSC